MKLPDLRNFDLKNKTILLRVNYDVPLRRTTPQGELLVEDDSRIVESLPTINYLLKQKAKIILLSHLGRPEGKVVEECSLRPCAERLQELLPEINIKLNTEYSIQNIEQNQIVMLENLRFDPGEENNDPEFAKKLASLGDFYIDDAFAVSHRAHASVVGLPSLLPHAAGFDLLEEVSTLSGIMENPKRPVVLVLGGSKADKVGMIPGLAKQVDGLLVGGRLPREVGSLKLEDGIKKGIVIADLDSSKLDITKESAEKFTKEIINAGTVIWAGPMGAYEQAGKDTGTIIIAQAVAKSKGFKVVGGGDTEAILTKLNLAEKIDYISSGGGAMLEFLAQGDLPGLKALRD